MGSNVCSEFSLRPYNLETDKENLLSLWHRNLQKLPDRRFQWFYSRNEFHSVHTSLLLHCDKICGAISLLVREIEYQEQKIRTGCFCDFMVDKEYRTLLPALKLVKFAIKETKNKKIDLLLAMPNKNASAVFSRVGFDSPHSISRWVNLIDCHDKLNLPNSNFGKFMRKKISWACNFLKRITINFSFLGYLRNSQFDNGCSAKWLLSPDVDSNFSQSSMIKFVNWRYRDNPINDYFIFSVQYKSQFIAIIYSIVEHEACISQIIGYDNKIIDAVLNKFIHHLRDKNIKSASIAIKEPTQLQIQFRKSGFVKRPNNAKLYAMDLTGKGMTFINNAIFFEGDMDL